ncbi:MAG: methyltransferase domain-containing protein [Candidatus Lokiarchaeota archaeon]|nr:methyltransferase domain-containing protein [Candidatus Lokiarchaeota archaeon]
MNSEDKPEKYSEDYFLKSKYGIDTSMLSYEVLLNLNKWRLKKFRKVILQFSKDHKTLLDIGCAFGNFLSLFRNDFDLFGMDISEFAVAIANLRLSCKIKQANVEELIPFKRRFDIITAIDVVEHLGKPKIALQNIYNHLNENGLFFFQLTTVNNKKSKLIYDLFFSHDDTHIFIESIDEIHRLLSDTGLKKMAWYSTLFPIYTRNEKFVRDFCLAYLVYRK